MQPQQCLSRSSTWSRLCLQTMCSKSLQVMQVRELACSLILFRYSPLQKIHDFVPASSLNQDSNSVRRLPRQGSGRYAGFGQPHCVGTLAQILFNALYFVSGYSNEKVPGFLLPFLKISATLDKDQSLGSSPVSRL